MAEVGMSAQRSAQVSMWVAIVSLGIALLAATYAAGGELSSVKAHQAATDKRVDRVEANAEDGNDFAREVLQRLARIEGKIDRR